MTIKIIAAIMTALLLSAHIQPVCEARGQDVSAASAIVMETTARRVLYAKNADARLPMASTTKDFWRKSMQHLNRLTQKLTPSTK